MVGRVRQLYPCISGLIPFYLVQFLKVHVRLVQFLIVHVCLVHFRIVHVRLVHFRIVHVRLVHFRIVHVHLNKLFTIDNISLIYHISSG